MMELRGTSRCFFQGNKVYNNPLGFIVYGSPENAYCCNEISFASQLPSMVFVNGECISTLRNNTINGLQLQAPIGPQINGGNQWVGANNFGLLSGNLSANLNRFIVDPNQQGNTPQVIIPSAIALEWFRQEGTSGDCSVVDCGIPPFLPPDDYGDDPPGFDPDPDPIGDPVFTDCKEILERYQSGMAYANDPANPYPDQTRYTYTNYLINRLKQFGPYFWEDCQIPTDSLLVYFDWNELETDMENIRRTTRLDAKLADSLAYAIQSAVSAVQGFYSSQDTVFSTIPPQYSLIESLYSEWRSETVNLNVNTANKAENIKQRLNALNIVHTFLQKRRDVWDISSKVAAEGVTSVTTAEWSHIRDIAYMCPDEIGLPVYEAQSLLAHHLNEFVENDVKNACDTLRIRANSDYPNFKIRIIPNPSDGIFDLLFSENIIQGRLMIQNSTGHIVKEVIINDNDRILSMDLSEQPPGVYYFVLYNSDVISEKGKILLIR